ncbi:primosomal replication protein PriC [Metabacillus sp. cB07]|uniref:primosomal replication protein PriC n=1 Tax=Metabacillus sp. cB07 TaxID=2806989 RepID=UPI00193ACDBF|nr:primosomal replication protein PriC [Metabacillus sp. cB07]
MNQVYKRHRFDSISEHPGKAEHINAQLNQIASEDAALTSYITNELAGSSALFIDEVFKELSQLQRENEHAVNQYTYMNHMLSNQYTSLIEEIRTQSVTIRYDKKEPVS